MSHNDAVRSERIGNQLTVEWRADPEDPVLNVKRVWRPAFPLRPFANQAFALSLGWVAIRVPFEPVPYVPELFSRMLVGVLAILVSYLGVAEFVNRTTVTLGRAGLSIKHEPLPWRGNREIPLASLSVARTVSFGDDAPYYYAVQIIAGLEARVAITGLDAQGAQRVADILNESIDRLQQIHGTRRPTPG